MVRGLALNRPGTSVQISRRAAASLAAKYEAEVSEPPRPRSTVSPASFDAMNPCVMMTPSTACHASMQGRIGREIAGCRQKARLHIGAGALLGTQHVARVDPAGGDALRVEKRAAERGREQLAHRHHPRAATVIDCRRLAAIDAREILQLREKCLEHGRPARPRGAAPVRGARPRCARVPRGARPPRRPLKAIRGDR